MTSWTTPHELFKPRRRFFILLLALLSMLFGPVFIPDRLQGVVGPIFFTVVLITALAAVARTTLAMVIGALFAITGCGLIVLTSLRDNVALSGTAAIVAILFLVTAAATILRYVLRADHVDSAVILASLCVYMLAAVVCGESYVLMDLLAPGSFRYPSPDEVAGHRSVLYYFSFVTITTVGYGDISPVSALARAVAATEAVVGQFYLVVLVARLVGLHTAHEARQRTG